MRDLVDTHRASLAEAASARDSAIMAATTIFHEAVSAYRDATQRATDEYNAAVTGAEMTLVLEMEARSHAFFGEVPVKEPVIRVTAPRSDMPNVADAPAWTEGLPANGEAAGAEGGQS